MYSLCARSDVYTSHLRPCKNSRRCVGARGAMGRTVASPFPSLPALSLSLSRLSLSETRRRLGTSQTVTSAFPRLSQRINTEFSAFISRCKSKAIKWTAFMWSTIHCRKWFPCCMSTSKVFSRLLNPGQSITVALSLCERVKR